MTLLMLLLVWYLVKCVLNSLRRQQKLWEKKQPTSWLDVFVLV